MFDRAEVCFYEAEKIVQRGNKVKCICYSKAESVGNNENLPINCSD